MTTFLLPYSTGTIAVTNGTKTVTGTTTAWQVEAYPGDLLEYPIGGRLYPVQAVVSNTSITLIDNMAAATASGQTYRIHRVSPGWAEAAEVNAKVSDTLEALRTGFAMTSLSSVALGTGNKTFTVQSGLPILPGARVIAAARASPTTQWMTGAVTAYSGTTLTISVGAGSDVVGSGTIADWTINLTGPPGVAVSTTTALSVGTLELGNASDTTISRSSAGNIAVEGNVVYRAGGTDVALADGGTGASLADPNADRIMFWDDSAGSVAWLTPGTGLTISGTTIAAVIDGLFVKADIDSVAFTKTGNGTAQVKAGTKIEVDGVLVTFASATSITMPALTAGTDYAIYVCTDGTIRADSSFTAPSGYTTSNSRQVGGFHYAPGGNAAAQAGGNTTAQINEYSLWDLKWRPACPDPRGMTLVADSFWCDIYLTGVDHHTNGTSKYNVTIANGSAPPKIPSKFGGNGSTAYSNYTWWTAAEVLQSHGKSPLSYDEFAAAAYGTTEATSSGGSNVPTTGVSGTGATSAWNVFTSKWGVIQSSGCIRVWGDEFGGGAAAASWTANTDSRGSTFQMENAAVWGGGWNFGSVSGSRCSLWNYSPARSDDRIGSRGRCDHLRLV